MNKTWMLEKNKLSKCYQEGVEAFLQFSKANVLGNDGKIFCPCRRCKNSIRKVVDDVRLDLHLNGFLNYNTNWVFHGETIEPNSTNPCETGYNDAHNEYDDNSPIDELPELLEEVREARNSSSSTHHDTDDFERLMNDAKKEAYPGCQKYSVLLYVVTLLHIKVMGHWSNKSFNMLLEFLKDLLPEGNIDSSTLYGAKSMLSGIGMKYDKIDACKHDCALFWKENQDKDECPVCGESRWKFSNKKGKKVPQKVLWYFPLQPRLQRLFMSSKSALNMRWHAEKRVNEDGVMRHPADSPAWKEFDTRYPDFAQDPRTVRLGLATDGFNPFGDKNNGYSIWPVILVVYNMSAFEFLKQEYFMLTLLISGPSSPGNNIDVYLRPLIDELKNLWISGIETYDAHSGEVFQMHAAILWTINDLPAYGYLSGWSTSGYKACPRCLDETSSIRLRDKTGFIGHRRFLRIKHPWRTNKRAFDGKVEKRVKPKEWSGSEILQRLRSHEHLFDKLGKRAKKKRKFDSIISNWRKISIFNELPYWPYNKLPHNIDVMHVEKTVSESLTGTIFGIEGKSKDTVKAREDLRDMGIRSELHIQDDGKKPKACYTLSPEDRKSFCDFLRSVKFPDGYASNISRCVKDGKIQGLKSHDYHVFLQRLLGIGVRGFLTKEVNEALVELSHFFRDLCSKTLKTSDIDRLEENIPVILCKLEKIFPPAFFDVMIHLAIHLPHEARLGGPVHSRWMYPFERYIGSLKRYVRNKARPEGSIAQGYISSESLTFISKYLHGVETKFNRRVRNEDNVENEHAQLLMFCLRVRPFGNFSSHQKFSQKELDVAHTFILNNVDEIDHYKMMYMDEVHQTDVQNMTNLHEEQFRFWLKSQSNRLLGDRSQELTRELWALANGPIPLMTRFYTGCIVNQVRFHTKDWDDVHTTQNSGVVVEGHHIGRRLTRGEFQHTTAQSNLSTTRMSIPSSTRDEESTNMPKKVKKTRGISSGENIYKAIAKNGRKKLQIFIPDHLARPVEHASLLATGIGIIMRHHAPLNDVKSYDDMLPLDREKLYGGLKAWFEFVDIETDPEVQVKLDAMLRIAFTRWKNQMHVAYQEIQSAGQNPVEDCPFGWLEEGFWKAMCDSFEDPKYKRRSDVNKENRSKLEYPHASGSQPFHVRYYSMPEAERSHVKNWRECHTKKNGCMVNEKAELIAEEMDTKKRQRYEAGEPIVEEDILAETLERTSGYRKGMGHGFVRLPPRKRVHNYNSEAMKNAREQLQEQQSQLVHQQTQIENQLATITQLNAKIEQQNANIEQQNAKIDQQAAIQIKIQDDMAKLLALCGGI